MPQDNLAHARRMRREPTEAEARLWRHLRAHRFAGFKFKRQQPIDHYIVDLICLSKRLVIEVDGSQHVELRDDDARTAYLERQGFRVIRFWNDDVLARTELIMDEIWRQLHV